MDGDILTKGDRSNIVFYGDGGSTGRLVVVDVSYGQGHGVATAYIGTAEAAVVQAQVGDGAVVTAAIVDTCGGDAAGSVGIQLDGQVLTECCRGNGIFNADRRGTGGDIAIHIGNGEGHGVVHGHTCTIEGGVVKHQAGNATGIAAAIVHICGGDAGVAAAVQLNGDVLANCVGRNVVLNGDVAGAGRGVAIHIGHSEGHGVEADIGTGEVTVVQRQAGDATGITATIVDGSGSGAPRTIRIQLNGDVLANGYWSHIVYNCKIRTTVTGISVDIGHGEGDGISSIDIVTIKAGIVQTQISDCTVVIGTIVYIGGGDRTIATGVQ